MFKLLLQSLGLKQTTAIQIASDSHRLKVLRLYRHLLKAIRKKVELQFMFRSGKEETIPTNIKDDIQLAEEVLSRIRNKEYPPFPTIHKDQFADVGANKMIDLHDVTHRNWYK